MIVLFSSNGDHSTHKIIDWLIHFEVSYLRVNLEDEHAENIVLQNDEFNTNISLKLVNGYKLQMNKVNYCVFRGGLFKKNELSINSNILPDDLANMHIEYEIDTLIDAFYKEIDKKSLSSPLKYSVNKLNVLNLAMKKGLSIPAFIVASNKKDVLSFFSKEESIITKALYETVTFDHEGLYYYASVSEISIDQLPNKFFPSLFQKRVKKKYEIRSFFFNEESYSIIIKNSNSVDFRDDYGKIEFEIYKLNFKVEQMVIGLMKKMGLNTGSVDFIVDENEKLYFLEINPIGQFDWVSQVGGYNLYYKIAIFLKSKVL